MEVSTQANFFQMKYQAQVDTFGLMVKHLMESGSKIRCMATVNFSGRTGKSMLGSLKMTNAKEKVSSLGKMAESTTECGEMANSMARVCSLKMEEFRGPESGRMEEIWTGLMNECPVLYFA